jgi:hypothetical protein
MFTKLVCVGTYFKNTKPHWAAQRYLFIYNYISNLRIKLNGIVFVYQRVYSYLDKAWSWVQHDEHGKGFIYFWFLMVPSYDRVGATYWYITIVPLLRHFNTSHRLWLCNLQKYWGLSSPSSAPLSTTVQKQSVHCRRGRPSNCLKARGTNNIKLCCFCYRFWLQRTRRPLIFILYSPWCAVLPHTQHYFTVIRYWKLDKKIGSAQV